MSAKRIAEFIKPLQVKPGSKVNLATDFDPGYKADFLKKKDGGKLLRTGIELLADYQFSAADVRERRYWDDYQRAFSEMLSATSTEWAPWYVIPADRKWFARICAGAVLVHTLMQIDPRYPAVSPARRQELLIVKAELEAEAPHGAAADPFAAEKPEKMGGHRRVAQPGSEA